MVEEEWPSVGLIKDESEKPVLILSISAGFSVVKGFNPVSQSLGLS